MKDEFKLIAWFVSGTFRFIFALLVIFGGVLLFLWLIKFSEQFNTPNFPWGVFIVTSPFTLLLMLYYWQEYRNK